MALRIDEELRRIARVLCDAGIDYALCGGLAVALHGYPRATRDIDILIREEDLDRVLPLVEAEGYTLPAGIIEFNVGKPHESRVYRVSKAEGSELMTLDLALVSAPLEDVWNGRETYDFQGQGIRAVSFEGLLKMKRMSGRPQDLADIQRLQEGDTT